VKIMPKQQAADSRQQAEFEDRRVLELVRDAARWRLLGRLFECPSDSWRDDIAMLACEVDDPELRAATDAALLEATEGLYHSVFGPGGPAPPREVSYHESLELGSLMSELTGCYSAFGYTTSTAEPPDHVAVEVSFLAYLRFKEAYALAAGDREHAALAAQAADRFTSQHVARLGAPLASVLADSKTDYLVRVSRLLAARAGRPPASSRLRVIQEPTDTEGGSGFACGDD
jgi:nitrate reductase assembly molybdenum cofactor insertion protein NarJ